jgi:RNA polymerase subunit RPABC4/transcription elongation factor Spt4
MMSFSKILKVMFKARLLKFTLLFISDYLCPVAGAAHLSERWFGTVFRSAQRSDFSSRIRKHGAAIASEPARVSGLSDWSSCRSPDSFSKRRGTLDRFTAGI